MTSFGQEKKWHLRTYINPGLGISAIQAQIRENGEITTNVMSRKAGLFWGGGFDLLKSVGNEIFVATNISFITKGYFASNKKIFLNGYQSGTSYNRDDLTFFETKINVEKHYSVANSVNKLAITAGLFYGKRPKLNWGGGGGLEFYGNDFGPNVSIGLLRKRFYYKLEFEKGLIDIKNDQNAKFKTSVVGIHIGYYIF